jgi:hypothetical protein
MQNKAFNITIIVVIVLLIGFVVWQQVNIMGIKSDLLRLEPSSADVESIMTDLAEVKSTFADLSEIESNLRSYQKLAILALASYSMDFAQAEYYLATLDLDKAQSYLDDAKADQGFFLGHLDEVDELMDEKVALLKGWQSLP